MKELDFDLYLSNEAGKVFYRSILVYGLLYSFRNHSLSKTSIRLCENLIEKSLWKPSNCWIQLKPRFRWFYCSLVISFTPYVFKKIMVNQYDCLEYRKCMLVGALNGSLISSAVLAMPTTARGLGLNIGAALIGTSYGALYCCYVRNQITK